MSITDRKVGGVKQRADRVGWNQCDSLGWAATYGWRYKGLRGMKWRRMADGTFQTYPQEYWPLACLRSFRAFRATLG